MDNSDAQKRPVTVADVAKAARVSKATAARVLGGYGIVSGKIRDQVLSAAAALEYRPNELARSMSTGRSGIIGVVVGDIENAFFSLAVRGITDAARAAGFNVIIANSGEKLDAEKAAIDLLIGKRVDGLIVTPARCDEPEHLQTVLRAGVPLVLFDRRVPGLDADTVTGNDRDAAVMATRYLRDRGHHQIAYITAMEGEGQSFTDERQLFTSAVLERVKGFLEVQHDAGVTNSSHYVRLGATDQQRTHAVILRLLNEPDRPTALIASDSLVGLRIFKSLQALDIAIPQDISLISFLDADWTAVTSPPITVIDQPVYEMGRTAGERLIARLHRRQLPSEHLGIDTRLIARGSVRSIA